MNGWQLPHDHQSDYNLAVVGRSAAVDDDKDADPLLSDPGNDQRTNDRLVNLSLRREPVEYTIHTLYIRCTYAVHPL